MRARRARPSSAAGPYTPRIDRLRQPLTSAQHRRLVALVERRAPGLRALASEAHVGPDDEPDREGVEAGDLLGVIEMQAPQLLDLMMREAIAGARCVQFEPDGRRRLRAAAVIRDEGREPGFDRACGRRC